MEFIETVKVNGVEIAIEYGETSGGRVIISDATVKALRDAMLKGDDNSRAMEYIASAEITYALEEGYEWVFVGHSSDCVQLCDECTWTDGAGWYHCGAYAEWYDHDAVSCVVCGDVKIGAGN